MRIPRAMCPNKISTLLLLAVFVLLFVAPVSADDWRVGNIVGLCKGTQIRNGPGYNYAAHTTVPENDWAVKIIDGPRPANGEEWWDTSRKAAGDPSGGTGWVSKRQATACKAAPPPPTTRRPTTAAPPTTVRSCTPPRCSSEQVLQCPSGSCPGGCGYTCVTKTPTRIISCTPPSCSSNQVLQCPSGSCLGGCGYTCVTKTPTPYTPLPRVTTPAPVTLDYICGFSTSGTVQSGFTGYPYPYIVVCSTNEKIGWGDVGFWGHSAYVQINDPVIASLSSPVQLNDGTIVSKKILRQSSFNRIASCAVCGASGNITLTPIISCTPPRCSSDEILQCPSGNCPGGCGYACVVKTVTPYVPPRETTPRETTPAPVPTTPIPESSTPSLGELRVVVAVTLSNATPQVGEQVIATFTIRNIGDLPVAIRRMVAGARGPNARGAANDGWSAPNVDFDAVTDLTLQRGETYSYRATRSFSAPGEYFAEPAWLTPSGEWEGIKPYQRVWFKVKDIPTITPVPPRPAKVRFPLGKEGKDATGEGYVLVYPFGGRTESTKKSTICFPGMEFRELVHAGEDWYGENWRSVAGHDVHAIAEGIVVAVMADYSPGQAILISHPSLGVWSFYGHLNRVSLKQDAQVSYGAVIGQVADQQVNSHLHFEIHAREKVTTRCDNETRIDIWGTGYVRAPDDLQSSGHINPTGFIRAQIGNPQPARTIIQQTAGTVLQGEKKSAGAVSIAANQARVDFAMRWPGSTLDLVVVDPQGRQVDERYNGAQWIREATRLVLTVQQPLPGNWAMSVVGKEVSGTEEPFEIIASAQTAGTAAGVSAGIVVLIFLLMLLAFGGGTAWIVTSAQSGNGSAPVICTVQGNLARPVLRLTRAQSFIGRDRRNALVLSDPTVSAQHARIVRHTNGYAIYDLGSKNGILVNGKRVTHHLLREGDRIKIGLHEMIYKQAIPPYASKG